VNGGVGFFLWRGRRAAGDNGGLGRRCCRRLAARSDKRRHQHEIWRRGSIPEQERGRGVVGSHRILRSCPQRWWTPASNFVALVAFQMQERYGKGRGEGGE
jgi:hypothetical protein